MRIVSLTVGFILLVLGFLWYRAAYWNTDFFENIGGQSSLYWPPLIPLGIGFIGLLILLYSLSPQEKSSVTVIEKIEKERIDGQNHLEESKKNHLNNSEKSI